MCIRDRSYTVIWRPYSNYVEKLYSAHRQNVAIHSKKVKQNRYTLKIVIKCIKFCRSFELALRAYDKVVESSDLGSVHGLV